MIYKKVNRNSQQFKINNIPYGARADSETWLVYKPKNYKKGSISIQVWTEKGVELPEVIGIQRGPFLQIVGDRTWSWPLGDDPPSATISFPSVIESKYNLIAILQKLSPNPAKQK